MKPFVFLSLGLIAWIVFVLVLLEGGASADPAPLAQPTIYVVNDSSLTDEEVADAIPAFQLATDLDFRPYWNAGAKLELVDATPKGGWRIEITDDIDCMFCAGYHDVTKGFVPYAKVLADEGWQVTFSHELFEMLADPRVNRAITTPGGCSSKQGRPCTYRWLETADPVEAFSYTRPGLSGQPVQISDFVTERWWDVGAKRGPFDFMRLVKRPLQVLKDGYEGLYDRR